MKTKLLVAALICACCCTAETLEEGFRNPPAEAKPHLWWHWMNGNVSKAGITADLESMAAVGIGGAQIFDAGCGIPPGPVAFGGERWFDAFEHAAKEARRLGLELCHANCSGWSSSGGPWITPDKAMKILCVDEFKPGERAKPITAKYYRDLAVLALPCGDGDLVRLDGWQAKALYARDNYLRRDTRALRPGQAIDPDRVVDLTDRFDAKTGTVDWTPPPGRWIVLRVGFKATDRTNHPASLKGVGLEVDKLSASAVRFHMEQYCERLVKRLGDAAGDHPYGLNNILVDSYEVGSQNWTDGFEQTFERKRGYSLRPYYPLLASGYVVRTAEESERVLEDFRRTVADEFAVNYAGALQQKCHELGLRLSVEPYGNCPSDNLQYGRYCDIPTGEFWSHGRQRNADEGNARLAAHVAHAWGRRIVAMESFSADPRSGGRWTTTPFTLKRENDAAFAAGANRIVYHRFVHQPWKDAYLPGLTMGRWGIHFERSNTWWYEQKEWLKYQARLSWMLMEGEFCADVLYYYGENAPNQRSDWYYGLENPRDIPEGYDYDQCARDTLLSLRVENGRLVNAAGISYAVLVLPPDDFMSVEVARKVEALVKAGATVIGSVAPTRAFGFSSRDDAEVRAIGGRLFGPDKAIRPISVDEALKGLGAKPDCLCATEKLPYRWIHRRGKDGSDWYFVSAHNAEEMDGVAFTFASAAGRVPELWNPETGVIERAAKVSTDWTGRLKVTLDRFPPDGSMFIVFRGPATDLPKERRFRTVRTVSVDGPWTVRFPEGRGAPAEIKLSSLTSWSDHPDPGVRYFSGTAEYTVKAAVPRLAAGERLVLDLGRVCEFAAVTINGRTYPTMWRPPFRQDVTDAVASGADSLELRVRVTNLWPNRLIGDERECVEDCEWVTDRRGETGIKALPDWVQAGRRSPTGRLTFTTWKHWRADDELLPSGILGPALFRIETPVERTPRTFCNPIALEDYPLGMFCRGLENGAKPKREPETWVTPDGKVEQFRELADPSLLIENGSMYLYPSCDLCWRSDDRGGTWTHVPQRLSGAEGEKDEINYAPTICNHQGRYLLIGGSGIVFEAKKPDGPFQKLGTLDIPKPEGWDWSKDPPGLWDPNYFSDDDGRLYFYWGCTPTSGIWGVECDASDPLKIITAPKRLIPFEPEAQPWEIAPGKHPRMGYLEGAWMVKRDGRYILTYAAAGTENREYAMGQAVSDRPLGPYVKPKNNPFFRKTEGFITGTSHGSIARDQDGDWWVAYTINANCVHWFERRLGIDRIEFDSDGTLKVGKATDEPQWLPGFGRGGTGWKRLVARSSAPTATDMSFKTYWKPSKLPATLTTEFSGTKTICAYRLVWRDCGLDVERGVKAGAYRYRVEYRDANGSWKPLLDASANRRDLLIDYRETDEVAATAARVVVLGGPAGISPAVVDFSPFGY